MPIGKSEKHDASAMRQKSISSSKYFAIQHFPLEVTDIPDFILAISLSQLSVTYTDHLCGVRRAGMEGSRDREDKKTKGGREDERKIK